MLDDYGSLFTIIVLGECFDSHSNDFGEITFVNNNMYYVQSKLFSKNSSPCTPFIQQ